MNELSLTKPSITEKKVEAAEYPWQSEYYAPMIDSAQVEAILAGMEGVDRATALVIVSNCLNLTMLNVVLIQPPEQLAQLVRDESRPPTLDEIQRVLPNFRQQARDALNVALQELDTEVQMEAESNL